MDCQLTLLFQRNCIIIARFIGNQCTCGWWHPSISMRLCNQHLFHNDTLKKNMCPLPVKIWFKIQTCCLHGWTDPTFFGCGPGMESWTLKCPPWPSSWLSWWASQAGGGQREIQLTIRLTDGPLLLITGNILARR